MTVMMIVIVEVVGEVMVIISTVGALSRLVTGDNRRPTAVHL